MSKHEAEFKNFMAELTLKILKAASEKYKTTEPDKRASIDHGFFMGKMIAHKKFHLELIRLITSWVEQLDKTKPADPGELLHKILKLGKEIYPAIELLTYPESYKVFIEAEELDKHLDDYSKRNNL